MDITVVGSGYVGLVVGACLAETGNHVVCADIDDDKVAVLSRGDVPIYEPGLDRLVERNLREDRLSFTTRVGASVEGSEVVFIAVGTPADEDGSADLRHVLEVARTIAPNLEPGAVVVMKSTVPVGTARRVREVLDAEADVPYHLCSNPEFLKEGAAVEDFMYPDRVVCGVENGEARAVLEELYEPFVRTGNPLIFMDVRSAEVTKYAANGMLATRISFMNQIAELCEEAGADVSRVRRGIGSDPRIGSSFLFAGTGYGGSCFPKDVRALLKTGDELGVDLSILDAVHETNARQKGVLVRKVKAHFGEDLTDRRVAVWGLSFKPETDDMREAPSLRVVEGLLEAGATVAVHDPVAMDAARDHFGDRVRYAEDEYAACRDADAMVLVTEWLQYRRPDWDELASVMRGRTLFDGRNLFEPERMRDRGWTYHSVGRAAVEGGETGE